MVFGFAVVRRQPYPSYRPTICAGRDIAEEEFATERRDLFAAIDKAVRDRVHAALARMAVGDHRIRRMDRAIGRVSVDLDRDDIVLRQAGELLSSLSCCGPSRRE